MVSFSTVLSHFPLFPFLYFSLSKVFCEKFHQTQSKAFPQQTALCKYRNYVVLFSFHSKLNKFLFLQKLPAERGLLWSSVWSSHRVSAFFCRQLSNHEVFGISEKRVGKNLVFSQPALPGWVDKGENKTNRSMSTWDSQFLCTYPYMPPSHAQTIVYVWWKKPQTKVC